MRVVHRGYATDEQRRRRQTEDHRRSASGNLKIIGNEALQNLNGLSPLDEVNGDLGVYLNSALIDIDGLSGLATVTGALSISNNGLLTSVDGLSGLLSLGGSLNIQTNSQLSTLGGLFISHDCSALSFMGAAMNINDNTSLPTCEAQNLIDYMDCSWAGDTQISGNDDAGVCPSTGACCTIGDLLGPVCSYGSSDDCDDTFYDGLTCDDPTVPCGSAHLGACCVASSCRVETHSDCSEVHWGTYVGDGAVCDGFDCSDWGSCCGGSEGGWPVTREACENGGGVFQAGTSWLIACGPW